MGSAQGTTIGFDNEADKSSSTALNPDYAAVLAGGTNRTVALVRVAWPARPKGVVPPLGADQPLAVVDALAGYRAVPAS